MKSRNVFWIVMATAGLLLVGGYYIFKGEDKAPAVSPPATKVGATNLVKPKVASLEAVAVSASVVCQDGKKRVAEAMGDGGAHAIAKCDKVGKKPVAKKLDTSPKVVDQHNSAVVRTLATEIAVLRAELSVAKSSSANATATATANATANANANVAVTTITGCGVTLAGKLIQELPPRYNSTCAADRAILVEKYLAQCHGKGGSDAADIECGKKLKL